MGKIEAIADPFPHTPSSMQCLATLRPGVSEHSGHHFAIDTCMLGSKQLLRPSICIVILATEFLY